MPHRLRVVGSKIDISLLSFMTTAQPSLGTSAPIFEHDLLPALLEALDEMPEKVLKICELSNTLLPCRDSVPKQGFGAGLCRIARLRTLKYLARAASHGLTLVGCIVEIAPCAQRPKTGATPKARRLHHCRGRPRPIAVMISW